MVELTNWMKGGLIGFLATFLGIQIFVFFFNPVITLTAPSSVAGIEICPKNLYIPVTCGIPLGNLFNLGLLSANNIIVLVGTISGVILGKVFGDI